MESKHIIVMGKQKEKGVMGLYGSVIINNQFNDIFTSENLIGIYTKALDDAKLTGKELPEGTQVIVEIRITPKNG